MFSGMVNPRAPLGRWSGFRAAHIFHMQSKSLWNTDATPGIASINSRQYGFLLRADFHIVFDNLFSISEP